MSPVELENIVAAHPFVRGMTPAHIRILSECAMLTRFAAGEVVFHEGEIANRFYLIRQGKVSLASHDAEPDALPLQTIGSGDVLGWSWLFAPYYWHFDACALEPTEAIFFYGTRLREHCEEDGDFGYQLMRRVSAVLIQRLQTALKESHRLARRQPIAFQNRNSV